jgi:hypothetical protein
MIRMVKCHLLYPDVLTRSAAATTNLGKTTVPKYRYVIRN